jgi:predicted ATPase
MVGGMAGARVLPEEVSAQILGRTDGVPLFVEELTKAVLESGLPADHAQPAVPAMLHDTLMARLDRTAAMKGVAQTAAVLGRDFSEALLAAVSPLEGGALAAALDALVRAELLFRKGRPPHAGYVFKHALVRDIAYESLLVSSRRQLHARTAAALERAFPEIAEAQPELLAHHHEAAGMPERAIAAWRRAGARAAASSNYVEAERQLARALALLPQLPAQPCRARPPDGPRRHLPRDQGHGLLADRTLLRARPRPLRRGGRGGSPAGGGLRPIHLRLQPATAA